MRIVQDRTSRQTGTRIQVIDNRDESFDVGGESWITFCWDHGNYCEHETRALAEHHAPVPGDWCEECQVLDGEYPRDSGHWTWPSR